MSGQWAGSTRRQRLPPDWFGPNGTRARILKRDNRICYVCHGPNADAVDHKNQGDDHSDANLAAIHQDVWPYCHRTKSSSEGGQAAAAAARRRPRKRPQEPHPGLIN